MLLVKTSEELAEAKAKKVAEFKALPDRSIFDDDNRATETLMLETFEKLEELEVGDCLDTMHDNLWDLAEGDEVDEGMDYIAAESIGILEWAGGLAGLDG